MGEERYHDDGSGLGGGAGILSGVWQRRKLLEDVEKQNRVGNCGGMEVKGESGPKSSLWYLPSLHTPKTVNLVTIVVTGRSFLYHQVRNVVGCLVEVGRGKLTPEHVKGILEKRDRSCAPGMAPPQGLFLVDVEHGDFRF